MNWFKRHLNWTWVIFFTLTVILAFSVVIYTGVAVFFWIVYLLGTIFVGMWVLKYKNRTYGWLFPTCFLPWIPLVLHKKLFPLLFFRPVGKVYKE